MVWMEIQIFLFDQEVFLFVYVPTCIKRLKKSQKLRARHGNSVVGASRRFEATNTATKGGQGGRLGH